MNWMIRWKDERGGLQEVVYSGKQAVLNHVETCLNKGWSVEGVTPTLMDGRATSVFYRDSRKVDSKTLDDRILTSMARYGEPIHVSRLSEEMPDLGRTDSTRKKVIRERLYYLRKAGFVETVSTLSRGPMWRLTGVQKEKECAE